MDSDAVRRRATPPAAPLEVLVTGDTVTVRGEADMSNEQLLAAALGEAIAGGGRAVHLDLTGLDFLASSAWRLVLRTAGPMCGAGGRLRVTLPSRSVVAQVVDVLAPSAGPGVVLTRR